MKKKSLINLKDKIYVAGHKGMVGSAILRLLKKNKFENILTTSKLELNLLNAQDVDQWFCKNKPDIVILAAAKVGGILANENYPVNFLLENIKIQNNVIESAWKSGTRRLLFLGSSCIYPKLAKQPIKEEYLNCGELEKTNEWYATAKISGIKLCEAYKKQYNFDSICLMPTNLYGPGDNYHSKNSHVIPSLIKRFYDAKSTNKSEVICWGSGNPKREFLHVEDLAEASIFTLRYWNPKLENGNPSNNVSSQLHINVGTGKDLTIRALAKEIASIIGFMGEIKWDSTKEDGTPQKLLDVSKLKNMGWSSKINLQKGLRDTFENFKEELASGKLRI